MKSQLFGRSQLLACSMEGYNCAMALREYPSMFIAQPVARYYFCRKAWLNDITSGPTIYSKAVRWMVGTMTVAGMPG